MTTPAVRLKAHIRAHYRPGDPARLLAESLHDDADDSTLVVVSVAIVNSLLPRREE